MRINSEINFVWSTKQSRYIFVSRKSINWTKSVAFCKGASASQNDLAAQQASFYTGLTNDYNQQFGAQNAITNSITSALNPIIAAGPNQFGFSTGETNTLNSQALQGTGQEYAKASQAQKANQAAQGGGNSLLPSGVQSQQQAGLASAAANQSSSELLGIQQAGYTQGNQNFNNAVGQEDAVAGLLNPTGYSGAATSAGGAAASEANTITQENNAASPWGLIGGVLGGVAGSFVGMPGLGASLGGALGGGLSGSSGAGNGQASGVSWGGGGTDNPDSGYSFS